MINEHVGGYKIAIPAFVDNEVNTSSDSSFYNYVRIDDFIKVTGITPENFHSFCAKELLDNACDFLERYYSSNTTVEMHIEEIGQFSLTVSNPNEQDIQVFPNLNQTFNYRRSFSSKSNQYKVTRGAQGDAIKRLGTMPYMLQGTGQDWTHPLSFQHNKKLENVFIHVDRKNGKIVPRIEPGLDGRVIDATDTVIRMQLPAIKSSEDERKFAEFLKIYTLFNTQISFRIYVNDNLAPYELKALQSIAKDFKNPNSVYCYDEQELIDFLNDIIPKSMSVYDAISRSGFREINQRDARFDYLKNIAVEQITDAKVRKLHEQLTKSMLPMSKLSVPYNIKTITRRDALIKRYSQIKPASLDVDLERAVYARTKPDDTVHIEFDNNNRKKVIRRFPYIFEALAIPIKPKCGINDNIIISGVNYSTSPTNQQYFNSTKYTNEYQWEHRKTHQLLEAGDIEEIIRMSMVGRNVSDTAYIPPNKQKVPCVLIAHLVAPRIEYISYGKSQLILAPFARSMGETIQNVILKLPPKSSYTGLSRREEKEKRTTIECLRELLGIRWNMVKANPLILDPSSDFYDPWSQSTVWYYLREEYLLPLEKKYGIVIIKENTRDDVTAAISEECERLPGSPTRERLGIFVSPRATMYFRGRWYNVDIKEIPALAGKGTDVVFIEKRGVVEQIKHISDIHGVAFVNTQGHFAEYPRDLVPDIIRKGGYVVILTDFDCAGIHIAERVISELAGIHVDVESHGFKNSGIEQIAVTDRIKRLGVDLDTLDYFVSKGIKDKEGKLITSREELQEIVQESYPKHQEAEKQQPGL
jgi:hypothetical protein